MMFERVAIVGMGLMGGSLGLALRQQNLARQVVGVDRSAETLERARERGALDQGTADLAEAVRGADCVVLATPVGQIPALLETLAPLAAQNALVTDLGSVKARIVETGACLLGSRFVGGHPMAGSERNGIEAARFDLFAGAAWAVIAPPVHDSGEASPVARLTRLIEALEARPVFLDAVQHDRLVALVSHLPHLLSFAFARTIGDDREAERARSLAGGSFRDLSRGAQSDATLWSDIFQENRAWLLAALPAYKACLEALESALKAEDFDALQPLLTGHKE